MPGSSSRGSLIKLTISDSNQIGPFIFSTALSLVTHSQLTMPKITSNDTTLRDIKPYARAGHSDSDTSTGNEPSTPIRGKKTSAVRSPGKAWSEEEKLQLFDLVITHGASRKAFEGQIEGRTGNQCYMAWK